MNKFLREFLFIDHLNTIYSNIIMFIIHVEDKN